MFFKEQKKQFPGGVQKSGGDQKGGLRTGQVMDIFRNEASGA